jgi:hypothetical protein
VQDNRRTSVMSKQKYQAKWAAAHRQEVVKAHHAWRDANLAKYLLNATRQTARRKGMACDLTLEDVQAMLLPGRCMRTGVTFNPGFQSGGSQNPYAPSIDRVSSKMGYTRDNVQMVCWAYNRLKGDLTDEMCQLLIKHMSQRIMEVGL